MTHKFALPEPKGIPNSAQDGTVLELARVWVGPDGPAILVSPAFDDPFAMGEMLAELAGISGWPMNAGAVSPRMRRAKD